MKSTLLSGQRSLLEMNPNKNLKKILIVSRSFYPETSPRSFRTTELLKEFSRRGHDVTLITLKKDEYHIPFEKEHGVKIKNMGNYRLPTLTNSVENKIASVAIRALRRFLYQFFEYPDIELRWKVKNILKNEKGYDLMISVAVPHPVHWGVAAVREKKKIAGVWVADCGDPYMGAPSNFRRPFYFKYLEKDFCRKADYISVPDISMRQNYYPEFHDKVIEIPQGFNFEEFSLSRYQKNPVPTFAYAGSFMKLRRNPQYLLKALSKLDCDFRFIVFTRDSGFLDPFKSVLGHRLDVRDYVPRSELLKELSRMDFLINIGYDPAHQKPSKLIDYYLSGRPVLNMEGNDVDVNLLKQFFDGTYDQKHIFKNMNQFRIERVCDRFLNLL